MSRRNLILLIIVLSLAVIFALWFLAFRTPSGPTPDDGGFFSNLNPFGNRPNIPPKTTPGGVIPGEPVPPTEAEKAKLVKVSSMPVAGFVPFLKERLEKEFLPAVRYVAKENGNIYQTFAEAVQERKFTGTVIPRVYEAFFGLNGESVIMRYTKSDDMTIETFLGIIPKEKIGEDTVLSPEVRGSFLPENITSLAISRDRTRAFYILDSGESAAGIILNLKDNKRTQVFNSPFTEWLPYFAGTKSIAVTKASGAAPGYAFIPEPSKNTMKKILGPINGLTALPSQDGNLMLWSDNNLSLNLYSFKTGESRALGLRTLPEKCAWRKDGVRVLCAVPKNALGSLFPDSWYQGEVSFNDQVWEVNTENGTTTFLFDPVVYIDGQEIDVVKLDLDSSEKYLFFVNKKDSFLWKYDLE